MALNTNRTAAAQPPALPQATNEYQRSYQDQFNSVVRLFFTRLDNRLSGLLSPENGGVLVYQPHAILYSASDQTASTINTATPVEFEVVRSAKGVTVSGDDNNNITVLYPGVWQVTVSLEVISTNDSTHTVSVWTSVNGTNVAHSAKVVTTAKVGTSQINYTYGLLLDQNDVVEVNWATTSLTLSLSALAATSVRPGVASASVSVVFNSNKGA